MTTIRVGAEQLRRELADLLARVGYAGDQVIVERHGTPQAVLIPFALYQKILDLLKMERHAPATEEEIEKLLLEKGILLPRDPLATAQIEDDWKPVPFKGKPLSEIIIEERR